MKGVFLSLFVLLAASANISFAETSQSGEELFQEHCTYCHAPGLNHPGTLQLTLTRGEAFGVLETRDDLVADYVKYIVRHGLNAMPSFKPSVLPDKELDALAEYLRH